MFSYHPPAQSLVSGVRRGNPPPSVTGLCVSDSVALQGVKAPTRWFRRLCYIDTTPLLVIEWE
jgi:hypothetical protein